jgi:hypothetical protein
LYIIRNIVEKHFNISNAPVRSRGGSQVQYKLDHGMVSYLNKQPRGDQSQTAVLSVESIVVGVEREMVQVEESVDKRQQKH